MAKKNNNKEPKNDRPPVKLQKAVEESFAPRGEYQFYYDPVEVLQKEIERAVGRKLTPNESEDLKVRAQRRPPDALIIDFFREIRGNLIETTPQQEEAQQADPAYKPILAVPALVA